MNVSTNETDGAGRVASRLVVWGLPLFAAFCGLALIIEGLSIPLFMQYTGLGPGFVPFAVGLGLLVVAAALGWQVMHGARFQPEEAEGADVSAPVSKTGFGLAALAILSPVASFPLLGFPIGAAISFLCVTRAFGSTTTVKDLIIGVILASLTWFAFTKLGVQLGPFLALGSK